jgi:hypothetical protein
VFAPCEPAGAYWGPRQTRRNPQDWESWRREERSEQIEEGYVFATRGDPARVPLLRTPLVATSGHLRARRFSLHLSRSLVFFSPPTTSLSKICLPLRDLRTSPAKTSLGRVGDGFRTSLVVSTRPRSCLRHLDHILRLSPTIPDPHYTSHASLRSTEVLSDRKDTHVCTLHVIAWFGCRTYYQIPQRFRQQLW